MFEFMEWATVSGVTTIAGIRQTKPSKAMKRTWMSVFISSAVVSPNRVGEMLYISTISMSSWQSIGFIKELGDTTVAAGTYTYPFECQLPREIPSSLEVPCGSIKYVACVVLDRPSWQIPTPQFPFTVVKPLNLSTHSTVHVRNSWYVIDDIYFSPVVIYVISRALNSQSHTVAPRAHTHTHRNQWPWAWSTVSTFVVYLDVGKRNRCTCSLIYPNPVSCPTKRSTSIWT